MNRPGNKVQETTATPAEKARTDAPTERPLEGGRGMKQNRIRKGLQKAIVSVVALGAVAVISAPASAHGSGTTWPRHEPAGGFRCLSGGVITAYLPNQMGAWYSGIYDNVKFSVDLFKYTSNGWVNINSSKPWYNGVATNGWNGYLLRSGTPQSYKWFSGSFGYGPVTNFTFYGLTRGSYAVKQYSKWTSSGQVHEEWASLDGNPANGATCNFS